MKNQGKATLNSNVETSGRVAIVNSEKCKPKKCNHQCMTQCPVNKTGKICVNANKTVKQAEISEALCIGCGICVKKCPFEAIKIINLPKGIPNECVHRYGRNSFKLYRLPQPRLGHVLGIVGTNGIGKTTALSILTKRTQPNLGQYDDPPNWTAIIKHFKGSELQNYFLKSLENDFKPSLKPQYVDALPKKIGGKVRDIMSKKDERGKMQEVVDALTLNECLDKEIKVLSGGEIQRFAIAVALLQNVNVYLFDEPTSYLDVKQRLTVSNMIRDMINVDGKSNYVLVVEHDLSVLDYMSDYVCVLYGVPSAYGVVTMPHGVREGINSFLAGFLPTENMRFRDEELSFQIKDNLDEIEKDSQITNFSYPKLHKKLGNFELDIEPGEFTTSQIIVLLGENGTGKTTFVKILAGIDKEHREEVPEMKVSFKPQTISPNFEGTVYELLYNRIGLLWETNVIFKQFIFDVCNIKHLFQRFVKSLSGGEAQRVGLIVAFGKPADVYLIDEPSAYLDCEQRLLTAKGIKRFILHTKKTAFIVEHDFIMATYLADKVIVYEGTPGSSCKANTPCGLVQGMNKFLSILNITFRRDPTNYRPRINKLDSMMDKQQKSSGNYFCTDESTMLSRSFVNKGTKGVTLRRLFSSEYDVCIIGGGPGGYVAAIKAAQLGLNTVCVEKRGSLGGTCLNVGCIPSKALLNISHKYEEMNHAKNIGINTSGLNYDWKAIQEKKTGVVNGLTRGIEGLFKKNKVTYKVGAGELAGNGQVNVALNDGKKETIKAKNIVIATGSEATPFPGINFDEKVFVSSTGALSLEKVPETMTVIGAGVIGLELGSVYARLGTKVTVVEFLDRICPSMDTEMGLAFQRALSDQGIKFKFNTKVVSGKIDGGKASLKVQGKDGGAEETINSDVCLVAIGRKPYTGGLGCEKAGVKLDGKGRVDINDHFQTNVKGIYAIGDVVTGPMLAHKSEEEGVAVAEMLAGKEGHINYNAIPSVVYTAPEVAWVGKTEEECKADGIDYKVGSFPMMANSRSRANLDSVGKVKLISDKKTDRLIGAHIIANVAGELIGELTLAIEYGASAEDVARTCHAHPTVSEAIKEAALASHFKPIHM